MSLLCGCDFSPEDFDLWWEDFSNLKPMGAVTRRKRCCSCEDLINVTEDVIEFYWYRNPRNDIEERIHGDERVPLASTFMCEECSGLYLALNELGYGCLDINQPMKDYVYEHNQMREDEA